MTTNSELFWTSSVWMPQSQQQCLYTNIVVLIIVVSISAAVMAETYADMKGSHFEPTLNQH